MWQRWEVKKRMEPMFEDEKTDTLIIGIIAMVKNIRELEKRIAALEETHQSKDENAEA
jgi:hypothetical protein